MRAIRLIQKILYFACGMSVGTLFRDMFFDNPTVPSLSVYVLLASMLLVIAFEVFERLLRAKRHREHLLR